MNRETERLSLRACVFCGRLVPTDAPTGERVVCFRPRCFQESSIPSMLVTAKRYEADAAATETLEVSDDPHVQAG